MIIAENVKLTACPFCGGEVELWKYQEIIKCRFVCKKCKVEVEFPRGVDSKDCIKKWNRRNRKPTDIVAVVQSEEPKEELSETICMDQGPNQFKTISYRPTCHCGYKDCILDPAYIKATYPKWYAELHGEATKPEDVACHLDDYCKNGERYDDEDK